MSLELGGKSPNIVFDDCILDDAVSGAVSGIFAATGQTCIAGSRLLLQETIHDQFVEKLVAMAKTARLGDPQQAETQVGPVTTPPQYAEDPLLHRHRQGRGRQVRAGRRAGDQEEGGGKYFVKPTIFTGVNNKMRIAQEEVFGPVLSIIKFKDEEEAVRDRQRHRLRPRRRRVDAVGQARHVDVRSASRPARCGSTPIAR